MVKGNYPPELLGIKGGKMEHIITDNSSETISVVTDETRFSLLHEFKGVLPPIFNQYKVTILNKQEVRRLLTIGNDWLKNKVDNSLDRE